MNVRLRNYEPLLITLFRIFDAFLASAFFAISVLVFQDHARFLFTATLLVFLLTMLGFEYGGVYVSWRFSSIYEEVRRLIWNSFMVVIYTILIGFFLRFEDAYSRGAILAWMVSWPVVMVCERFAVRSVLKYFRRRGKNVRKAVIVGTGQMGARLARWIGGNPWSGTQIVGFFNGAKGMLDGYPVIGSYEELPEYVRNNTIDIVYIALPTSHSHKLKVILHELVNSTTSVYYVPDIFIYDYLLQNSHINYVDNIPIISIVESPVQGFNGVMKRVEDIVLGLGILLLISPLMLLIALVIRLTSKGPVIFKQVRYGLDGREIQIWKFRTMTVCEDGFTMKPATMCDERITKVGRFLRKFSMDEFPQFINVLKGDMSLVGPRPHAIAMVEEYRKQVNGAMLRHKIKPGITGLAQLYATRGEVDTAEKLQKRIEYDLQYLHRWSLWLDMKIIFLTVIDVMRYGHREVV